jgi:anthranilate synthase/aminodeoxychorismate synthase-like glutamine amidotransferase
MTVLILDNYDSFTWNLVHGLEVAGGRCIIRRSDAVTLSEVEDVRPDRIVLSPGPFGPGRSGICRSVIQAYQGRLPILGICLGMQVIATSAGASVEPSGKPVHGRTSLVWHDESGLFRGLPSPFVAARYHSLIVVPSSVPSGLKISAWSADGTVLGCRANGSAVEGLLFHPESFLTEHGPRVFSNFLEA